MKLFPKKSSKKKKEAEQEHLIEERRLQLGNKFNYEEVTFLKNVFTFLVVC